MANIAEVGRRVVPVFREALGDRLTRIQSLLRTFDTGSANPRTASIDALRAALAQ